MMVLWPMAFIILLYYKDPLRLTLTLYFTLALNKWSHLTTCYMETSAFWLGWLLYLFIFIYYIYVFRQPLKCFLFPSQIVDSELLYWRGLVAKCMTEYSSSECNKPDNKKLVWIVSRRTAQNLHANNFSVPELPTIPEGSWGESER